MPNVVKGSKQEKMVVVPHRPKSRLFFTVAVVSGILISAFGGFTYGYYQTLMTQQSEAATRQSLTNDLAELQIENSELRRQISFMDSASVVDRRANEEVQSTISELRDQVASLEQDVTRYRQVVSGETADTGLVISQFDLDPVSGSDMYRYKLVMRQQDADGDSYLEGHVNVNLLGTRGEEQVALPLKDISVEQDEVDIFLRFKYFQIIEGELSLPEGFTPESAQIAAVSIEPVEKSINQNFSWEVEN